MTTLSSIKSLPDPDLILKYKEAGDSAIIGVLFERYTHLVLGVCMKYVKDEAKAEDLVMEIFEKLLTDLKSHSIGNFKGWLYVLTKNHCLMYLRKEQSQMQKDAELKKDMALFMESGSNLHLSREETLSALEGCIEKLTEKQRISIELFFLQEKCYEEVSQIAGLTMNEVKSHVQNGKRNLKICMESKHE